MKNVAVLNPDNKIVYCAEWPDKEPQLGDYGFWAKNVDYQNAIEQALANGIEFKDQQEIRILWCESTGYNGPGVYQQKMELLKPYAIPEGVMIKIKDYHCEGPCCEECNEYGCRWFAEGKKFAFIERQPEEETQNAMILDITYTMVENLTTPVIGFETVKSKFRIERIK